MSIFPEHIEVGKCYLTTEGRIRYVKAIRPDDVVRYDYWSFPAHPERTWRSGALNIKAFAATVEREVPCDWTPEGDG